MNKRRYTSEEVQSVIQTCEYRSFRCCALESRKGSRFVLRLPFEIRYRIFERISPISIIRCVGEQYGEYRRIFELICRNNNIHPMDRLGIDWGREFLRFVKSLKTRRFHKEPDWTWTCYMDTKIGMEVTGRKLFVIEDYKQPTKDIQALMITMKMIHVNPPRGNSRKTHVLHQAYELRGTTLHCYFYLGNRHDLKYSGQKPTIFQLTFEGSANVTKLTFDNEDRVYYYETIGTSTRFFRKTFGTSDEPEFLCKTEEKMKIVDLSVGNDKLFITFQPPSSTTSSPHVMCVDLQIDCSFVVQMPDLNPNYNLVAHNNSFVYSSVFGQTIIYTFSESGMTPYAVDGSRRQVLNRNTYLILEWFGGKHEYMLKTITILDGEPIVQFVQYCKQECVFRRLGDNFFYVLERNRRQFWYQDDIGSRPRLIDCDEKRTKIMPGPSGYEFSSAVEP